MTVKVDDEVHQEKIATLINSSAWKILLTYLDKEVNRIIRDTTSNYVQDPAKHNFLIGRIHALREVINIPGKLHDHVYSQKQK